MKLSHQQLLDEWSVPRETMIRINQFIDVLYDWQQHINLISIQKNTTKEVFYEIVWERHIIDSLQILSYLKNQTILDLGSGGGFPGLIIAMATNKNIHLVESDIRKCEFLKEAARTTETKISVHNDRIENLDKDKFSAPLTITSRACASVLKLLELTKDFHHQNDFLLLKGEKAPNELEEAKKLWHMDVECYPSVTHEQSSIIHLQGVKPYV